MARYTRALTIAGSDSGGGAGIQADLKTFSALGCYGMSVVTALTAQNTVSVKDIHPVPVSFIETQMDAVLEDIGVDVVKIGMLHDSDVIEAVAKKLRGHDVDKIVVDPVMVAKSGDKLLHDEAVHALKEVLLPMATLITPNLPEAQVLLGRKEEEPKVSEALVTSLGGIGAEAVLLKGGHEGGNKSVDLLYMNENDTVHPFEEPRIHTQNTHGTGCTLSSAIASELGKGNPLPEAVKKGKAYLTKALEAGAPYELGHGHGPVHHFHEWWH